MRTLNLLDLDILASELKYLEGALVDKVFHRGSEVHIRFFSKRTKTNILKIKVGSFISITEYKETNREPTPFAMLLRKSIGGYTLKKIGQVEGERIFDFIFEKGEDKKILVVELFSKGNVILCEPSFNIIFSLKRQIWSGRRIQSGKKYTLPPRVFSPFDLNRRRFEELLAKTDSEDIVRFLAIDLGFGGVYSEEILALSSVDKNTPPKKLTNKEINEINAGIKHILSRVRNMKINPQTVKVGEEEVPLPFDFLTFRDYPKKYFDTYNRALDRASTLIRVKEIKERAVVDMDKELRKISKIKEEQSKKYDELKIKRDINQRKGELVYVHFEDIKKVMDEVVGMREKNVSWKEIKKLKFPLLKEIDENNGKLYFDIENHEIKIDITKDLVKSAEDYFVRSKHSKEKIKGLQKSVGDVEERLKQITVAKERRIFKAERKLPRKVQNKKWYEYFHWYTSSKGLFVISGKDAQSNETLIKKYMEPNDIVFHTEIAGSPFTIIKNGKDASKEEIEEAAIQTASFSKAWKSGYGTTNVYWVYPEQVSKTAPSGEYISKGGFMISGKKNYLKDVPLELAVGFKDRTIIGPKGAISKVSKYILIKPGYIKRKEASEKIQIKLEKITGSKIGVDSISSILPSGTFKIEK